MHNKIPFVLIWYVCLRLSLITVKLKTIAIELQIRNVNRNQCAKAMVLFIV